MEVKAMDTRQLEILVGRRRAAPCVSLYVPLTSGADGSERVRVELHALAREAASDLEMLGTSPPVVLGPLQRYTEERHPWPRDARGLGFFASRGTLEAFSVLHHVRAAAFVGPRFHVRPLLGMSQGNGRYFVLALCDEDTRLLEADRDNVVRVRLTGMPRFEAGTDSHPRAWLRELASRIDRHVAPTGAPLVLACEASSFAVYRDAIGYRHVVDRCVPADGNDEVLRDAAWECVAPLFSQGVRDVRRRYSLRRREGRSAAGLRAVIDAAEAGRIETLCMLSGTRVWGHYGVEGTFSELVEREPGAEDLFDRVATSVLAAGGHVLEFSAVDMPTAEPIAATLRF